MILMKLLLNLIQICRNKIQWNNLHKLQTIFIYQLRGIFKLQQNNANLLALQILNFGQTDHTLTIIFERLRNTSIIIALIIKYKQPKKNLPQKIQQFGQTIYDINFLNIIRILLYSKSQQYGVMKI
ncbi:unnamed protein product [Paramecium sonneborni]|uniref:Uncharacterized protein n=1 Tax=Paramecium sonneborni TaxID=65129 RepID=A0A8S1MF02_9CILI|nr:unnamed protein product [Paramecium sonneborni]